MGAMSHATTTAQPTVAQTSLPHRAPGLGGGDPSAAVAVCLIELRTDADRGGVPLPIQIFPAGEFGAPLGALMGGMGPWRLTDAAAAALIARVQARVNDLVVDFEHQSLLAASNGQPAPAAGWIAPDTLVWHKDAGLFAHPVRWTDRAAAMIAGGEYRYLSPVFTFDPQTGTPLDLINVALTNNPAIDGMQPVMLAAAASAFIRGHGPLLPEGPVMLKELRELLQLADENPTDAQVAAATQRLKQKLDEVATEVAALKAQPQSPDPEKFVPVAALKAVQDKLGALLARESERDVRDLIEPALTDGRLLPAQEAWARDLGKANLAALKQYLESAQPIAALRGSQTGGKGQAGGDADGLSPEDLAVCSQLGLSRDEFLKTRKGAN
jgi:phage I-like protein